MKNKKITMIVILFIIICTSCMNCEIYATGIGSFSGGDTTNDDTIVEIINIIISYILNIGIVLSVIIIAILGIKYMIGSVEDKAEYKKTLMPYFIGCICLFSTSSIVKFIYEIAKNI